jgi:O-antigen/teichoic acid export membrane protein
VTVATASVVAIVIGVLAGPAVALVYGNDFLGAVVPLQILLGAAVLYSAAHVLLAGLDASNRPLLAAGAEVSGALMTVVGLLLVLPSRGITGAAVVSLVSYGTVLICAAVLYRSMCTDSWAEFRPQRGLLRRLRAPLSEQRSQAEAAA